VGRLEKVNELESHQCNREYYLGAHEKCSIVVPMVSDLALDGPIKTPTYDEWSARHTTVSYHFETRKYALECHGSFDATPLRNASLNLAKALEKVNLKQNISRGRLPEKDYKTILQDSQFCLIIRGDTPSTHSFYDALAAHCIPVIVSDSFRDVATPFISSGVNLTAFTIQISQQQFSTDAVAVAERIKQITHNSQEMGRLYNGLAKHRPSLLWHIDGSKAGSRVLDDVTKTCRTKDGDVM